MTDGIDRSKIMFRTATPEDLEAVRTCLSRCGLETADVSETLMKTVVLARTGEEIAGTVGLEPCGDASLLRSLAVLPECRGQGLGRELVSRAEAMARSVGIGRLYLLTLTAPVFFEKLGYVRIGRDTVPRAVQATREFEDLCPETAVCMTKALVFGHQSTVL